MQFFNIAGINVGLFAVVIVAAALLAFGARQFGQTALCQLSDGPRQIMRSGMIISTIYAGVITALLWWMLALLWSAALAPPLALLAGMIIFINSLTPSWILCQNGAAQAAKEVELAGIHCAIALTLFDALDKRGRGKLDEDDLNLALQRPDFTNQQKQALNYLLENAASIGQLSERAYREERMVVSTSYGGFVSTIPEVVRHYTVGKEDLSSYPNKVAQRHQLWA